MYWENSIEEIENTARVLEMEATALNEKLEEIVLQHNLNKETDGQQIMAMFRNWAQQVRRRQKQGTPNLSNNTGSFVKRGFGMFVGMDEVRNNMQYPRDMIKAACEHDLESVYRGGIEVSSRPYGISLTTKTETGYQISYIANGEETIRDKTLGGKSLDENWFNKNIKDNSWEFELGWATPIDLTERFQNGDKNPMYSKPLALTDNTRRAYFIGQGPNDELPKYWPIQLRDKGESLVATNFSEKVPLFEPVYFTGVWNEERNIVYGTKNSLDTLLINSKLPEDHDDKIAITPNVLDMVNSCMGGLTTNLVNLDMFHKNSLTKSYAERLVITDGMVTNMQPSPNKLGNRTIWLGSLDNYSYDIDQYEDTVCWLPSHIDLDFGVGSQVLVIGRTSQRETTDEETGEVTINPVTINVAGLLVLERKGEPTVVSVESTDDDWW
tara:strand:+ start:402 stop:1718 length:1317 start_codon:yes stop_codon:yes gene_type:complete